MKKTNVLVYDLRLEGSVPQGNFIPVEVGKWLRLSELVSRLNILSEQFGKIESLQIMAHGIEEDGEGGFGIELCKDNLTQDTVHQLRPLQGKVDKIVLLSCAAAQVASNRRGSDGDGELLCKRIAMTTRSWVKASTYEQEYKVWSWEKSWGTDFGNWEGDCWWFSPHGMKYKADMTTY